MDEVLSATTVWDIPEADIASDNVCCAAPSPGVLVTAPDITPVIILRSSPVMKCMERVTPTARMTIRKARRFIFSPPVLNVWKKPGPT